MANQKQEVEAQIKDKHLIAFNASYDQTQLHRQGYNIWDNKWTDVALMARIYDNRLAERKIKSLEALETELLGTITKSTKIAELTEKYGKNFFAHSEIEQDPLFQTYALKDTKVTRELYNYLNPKVPSQLSSTLNNLNTKLAKWQAIGIAFREIRLLTT